MWSTIIIRVRAAGEAVPSLAEKRCVVAQQQMTDLGIPRHLLRTYYVQCRDMTYYVLVRIVFDVL